VPVIVFVLNDQRHFRMRAIAAGADAVFTPTTDAQERRTRLWALLRTRALHRQIERKWRNQGSEIVDRRRWLNLFLQDLHGSVATLQSNLDFMSRFAPPHGDPRRDDFQDSIDDARSVFDLLMLNVRTVADYERHEAGQLTLAATNPRLPERPVIADRELVKRAAMNLTLHAILRGLSPEPIILRVQQVGGATQLMVGMPGESTRIDRRTLFEPHTPAVGGPIGYGVGLAMARVVAQLHRGRIWLDEDATAGATFVFELGTESTDPGRGRGRPGAGNGAKVAGE
jgi:signal transduction histidine kinase